MKIKMVRVWAVFDRYHPTFSGSAVQGHQIYKTLVQDGLQVDVLTQAKHESSKFSGQKIERDGIQVHYIRVTRSREWLFLKRFRNLRKVVLALNHIISELSFNIRCIWFLGRKAKVGDIVHFHSFSEFTFIVEWFTGLRKMHPLLLLTLLGSDDPDSIQKGSVWGLRQLKLLAFKYAEKIVTLCTAQTMSCEKIVLSDRIVQIPCAVDINHFRPLGITERLDMCQKLSMPVDNKYIIFVGSAKHRKGIDVLIESFIQISNELPQVHLVIVGPSDFTDHSRHSDLNRKKLVFALKEKLVRQKLDHRVHWAGLVENVHQYMQIATVFCLPTRREGFGIVIIEAMATGLPVIVSELEGVTTDIVTPGEDGVLINNGTPQEYAYYLRKILVDEKLSKKLGQAARETALSRYALRKISQQFSILYEKAVNSKGKFN